MPTVTRIRKEWAANRTHQHLEGVCTTDNLHYTRAQVVASIRSGQVWVTSAGGRSAKIKPIDHCPRCTATPYITTEADSTTSDNLLSLPDC